MKIANKYGTPVDPVPFLVVAALAFTVSYTYFPAYFMALGAPLSVALVGATVLWLVVSAGAFYRYLWTARPDFRGEVPARARLRRLVYGALAGIGVIALLVLPLL